MLSVLCPPFGVSSVTVFGRRNGERTKAQRHPPSQATRGLTNFQFHYLRGHVHSEGGYRKPKGDPAVIFVCDDNKCLNQGAAGGAEAGREAGDPGG